MMLLFWFAHAIGRLPTQRHTIDWREKLRGAWGVSKTLQDGFDIVVVGDIISDELLKKEMEVVLGND